MQALGLLGCFFTARSERSSHDRAEVRSWCTTSLRSRSAERASLSRSRSSTSSIASDVGRRCIRAGDLAGGARLPRLRTAARGALL